MLKRVSRRLIAELRLGYELLAMLLPSFVLTALADEMLRCRHRFHDVHRRRKARGKRDVASPVVERDGEVKHLYREVLERKPSWSDITIEPCPIPTMLTMDEMCYYRYITEFYSGEGAVVEIGPWIGSSTYNIISGLLNNPSFPPDGKIHVYDDFVWRSSWMDKWLVGTDTPLLHNRDSFLPLFLTMTSCFSGHIEATAMKLMEADDNNSVPWFSWDKGLVELCFIDCGRALEMNETWYRALEPFFIPDRTIIVMQDWQNFKNVPEVFWENTKIFTDRKGHHLDLIHELKHSGTATFIYRK